MQIAILLLNSGRGSGEVPRRHAQHLIAAGHSVHFLHLGVGEGVLGAVNHDVPLDSMVVSVHEYLPAAGDSQRAVYSQRASGERTTRVATVGDV